MKLINILNTAFAGLLACTIWSCDTVDEDNRLIYVEPAEVKRSILIEDFTGQRCSNCPDATEKIKALQEEYGEDAIIAVAIHSGPFGHRTTMTSPRLPLCTETGDAYYTYWGIEAQPGVKINRGTPIYNSDKYGDVVRSAIQENTPLIMTLDTDYNQETGRLDINISAITSESLSGKLQVWIIENNIVAQQAMKDGTNNSEYVHQHVFRTSVTQDIYGDEINVTEGTESRKNYNITIDNSWVPENIAVVAFVSNSANGVLQVIKSNIIKNN